MKIIVANWKMNHGFEEADIWLENFFRNLFLQQKLLEKNVIEFVLCPPAILLDYLDSELMDDGFRNLEKIMKNDGKNIEDFTAEELTKLIAEHRHISLGAQDCHHQQSGSFTGNISAAMLTKVGCEYVIIGHSERRIRHFESNEIIAKKAKAAVAENLTPIICVGETKEVREQKKHINFVAHQLLASIPSEAKFQKLIIAYEPIWSIGSGLVPAVSEIAEMAKSIREILTEKFSSQAQEFYVLYGGSVTSKNSKEILSLPNIDGLLVGKASLDADEFFRIATSSSF